MSQSDLQERTSMPSSANDVDTLPQGVDAKNELSDTPSAKPAITFPDGGIQAWMVIIGCFFLSFSSYGQLNAFGTFTTYYVETLLPGHSASSISWIGSVQLTLTYVSGLMFGRVFDAYGARPLLVPGCFLSVFSLMMTSLATTYYQVFLAHGLGVGLGIALQFYPLMALPSHWFYRHRALAVGIVVSGGSLAGVIYPIMLSRLIDSIGFPWAVRAMAFFNLGLQALSIPLVKDRLPRNMKLPLVDLNTLREPIFLIYGSGGFLVAFGLFAPFWYIELYSLSRNLSPALSFYTISIMNAAGLVGRVLTGFLGDRFGKFNILIPVSLLSGVWSLALWTTANHTGPIIAFSILFGFTSAAVSSLAVACTGQLTPHPSRIGARVGMFSLFMAPGILTGPSIAGAILSSEGGGYLGLQIFVGIVLVAGSLSFLAARGMGLRRLGKY